MASADNSTVAGHRKRRSAREARRERVLPKDERPVWPGITGGALQVLSQTNMENINRTALDLLEKVGMMDATESVLEHVTAAGGTVSEHGRLLFPRSLVEDILAKTKKSFVLPGQKPEHDLEVGGCRVHYGTGGMSPNMVDFHTGEYRDSTLLDVYDAARLVDTLDNIHSFWRPVVACDISDNRLMDLNSLYACAMGTSKHLGSAFVLPEYIPEAVKMLDTLLGGGGRFRECPFLTLSCCPVVPPLRFAADNCDNLEVAIRHGMSATLVAASQAGATSPAALAGSIAQTVAETLACLVYANLTDPECRVLFAPKPFVADLRTGSMSGGSGEQALLIAASAQMARYYGIPGSVPSGMTDSKTPDAQSGFEKAITAVFCGHSGSTHSTQAAGGMASLMADNYESYVIDNDMLGVILRTVRGIEINEDTLSFEVIRDTVLGEGHFLSHEQTISRMEKDYYYGKVIDRDAYGDWQEKGRSQIRDKARAIVQDTLSEYYPAHVNPEFDRKIRNAFDIRLSPADMQAGSSRWKPEEIS